MALSNTKHWNHRRIERQMREQAEEVVWHKSQVCTCGMVPSARGRTRSDVNCTLCGGYGVYYHDPLYILAVVTGYDVRRDPLDMAVAQPGDLQMSPLPRSSQWIGDFDKIILPFYEDAEAYQGETVVRGTGSQDTVRYPIAFVEYCSSVKHSIETVYTNNIDFVFVPDSNTLTWISSNQPQANSVYALKYRARFEWLVFNPPNPRYSRGTDLGQRCLLRKRELVVRTDPATNTE